MKFAFDPQGRTTERREYMLHPEDRLMIDDSKYLHVPEKPGIGCELDEMHCPDMKSTQLLLETPKGGYQMNCG